MVGNNRHYTGLYHDIAMFASMALNGGYLAAGHALSMRRLAAI